MKQGVMTANTPLKPHNSYSSLDVIRLIKIRRSKGAGNVECIGRYKYRQNHSRNTGKEDTTLKLGHKLKKNIKMNLREICNSRVWIGFM